jgi:hypothetical protein
VPPRYSQKIVNRRGDFRNEDGAEVAGLAEHRVREPWVISQECQLQVWPLRSAQLIGRSAASRAADGRLQCRVMRWRPGKA